MLFVSQVLQSLEQLIRMSLLAKQVRNQYHKRAAMELHGYLMKDFCRGGSPGKVVFLCHYFFQLGKYRHQIRVARLGR
ncbi:MAG: hypothetical protein AAF804_10185, partial [Bacteroidota bacterium]